MKAKEVKIPLESLKLSNLNWRLDSSYNVNPLVDSICDHGIETPLLVNQEGVIIRGHRRHRALTQIQKEQPEVFKKFFAEGVPCSQVNCTPQEMLTLLVDAGNTVGIKNPHEVQLCANLHFAAGHTEESVANLLSGAIDQVSPPKGEFLKKIKELDEKIGSNPSDMGLKAQRRKLVADYRRGFVQGLHSAYRCPVVVMEALRAKAEGEGWGPTQSQVSKLYKEFVSDMADLGQDGLPKHSKTKPGPNFLSLWTSLQKEAQEKSKAKENGKKAPKSRSAKELTEKINEFKSKAVRMALSFAAGQEASDLLKLDHAAWCAEVAAQVDPEVAKANEEIALEFTKAESAKVEKAQKAEAAKAPSKKR